MLRACLFSYVLYHCQLVFLSVLMSRELILQLMTFACRWTAIVFAAVSTWSETRHGSRDVRTSNCRRPVFPLLPLSSCNTQGVSVLLVTTVCLSLICQHHQRQFQGKVWLSIKMKRSPNGTYHTLKKHHRQRTGKRRDQTIENIPCSCRIFNARLKRQSMVKPECIRLPIETKSTSHGGSEDLMAVIVTIHT